MGHDSSEGFFGGPVSLFNPLFADIAGRLLAEEENSERLGFLGPIINIFILIIITPELVGWVATDKAQAWRFCCLIFGNG